MEKKFEFVGFSYKQNPSSPELFAFVAPAEELVEFSGVARKSENFLTNYQRALDETRVLKEIRPFFENPNNCSPTSVVLSIKETPTCKVEFFDIDVKGINSGVHLKKLVLSYNNLEDSDNETIIELSKEFLDQRLANDDDEADITDETDENDENLDDSIGEDKNDAIDDEGENGDDGIEIGTSMLKKLREQLNEVENIDKDFIDNLREMLKPALVIDGQHRLFGASKVEEPLPMLVCALVEPDWKEQVFQFTVINDKATGIPKPFITSLAGMSLTKVELDELRERLIQAGVQLWEVEVMQLLGYDPQSIFCNKIEFKLTKKTKGVASGLGYQTMKRVGKAWYDTKSPGLLKVMKVLYYNDIEKRIAGKSLKTEWQHSKNWFEFFCLFWKEVEEKFGTSKIWEMHSPLMIAVVLEQFQEAFFSQLNSMADVYFAEVNIDSVVDRSELVKSKFKTLARNFVSKFEKKHFNKPYKRKSLNHKEGKELLLDYFTKIRDQHSVSNHALFREKA